VGQTNLPKAPALAALYSIAEVLVFPSLSEGFGWPPLEAMACGCPVIAARRASPPEVLGETCVYVDPTDAAAIAEAIRRVTANAALRSELVARGAEQSKNFGWGKTAERMLQLFASR
jgi:glycosyltransferase involved in cell wall biosynthesis